MIVSIHQPHFLPWLGYWNKVLRSDVFVWLDSVQYRKNYFQNRTVIKNLDGKPVWLTLPVHARLTTPISEVTVADGAWRPRVLKTLEQCYRRAPFFEPLRSELEGALHAGSDRLAEINEKAFLGILGLLEGKTRVVKIGDLAVESPDPTERLVEACRALGATAYIAGQGGRKYLRVEEFEKAGIEVIWQAFDPATATYDQIGGTFLAGLSVVDCLFNVGPARTREVIDAAWSP